MKAEIAGLRVAVFTFGPLIPALSIKLVFFPQQPVVKAGVRAFGIDVTALLFHALAGMASGGLRVGARAVGGGDAALFPC